MSQATSPDVRRKQRAKLPPPLVTIRAIEKLLLRHISAPPSGPFPEQRLIVAVICQAIADLRCGTTGEQRQARRFLLGDDLDAWATWVDLQPRFIREVAVKTLYLLPVAEEPVTPCESTSTHSERRHDAGLQSHHAPA
ncbi:MAG: hypothetical protein ORN28_09690 [Rhodoferax sp.]|nr:hypothetical protein [Rhodoferax sp.]